MKIWRLDNFIEIVKLGSINAAADKLHISPQALHQQMDTLENEVGCKLLIRSRKGVSLTTAGTVFYKKIGAIVSEYKQLVNDTQEADRQSKNTICTMSSGLFTDPIFLDAVSAFKDAYPELNPVVKTGFEIGKDSCDLAVNNLVYNDSFEVYSSVRMECFLHVPATHPLAENPTVSVEDLCGETIMVLYPELLDKIRLPFWKKTMSNSEISIVGIDRSESADSMVLSSSRLFLSWGPQVNIHSRIRQIRVLDSEFDYMMLYNKERYKQSESLRLYLAFMKQYYQENWYVVYNRILQA